MLLHYLKILLQNGPLIQFWSMRCESEHRKLRLSVQSTSSSRNLLKTVAIKQTLSMCYANNNLENIAPVAFGSKITTQIPFSVPNFDSDAEYFDSIEINGTMYKIGMYVIVDLLKIVRVHDV